MGQNGAKWGKMGVMGGHKGNWGELGQQWSNNRGRFLCLFVHISPKFPVILSSVAGFMADLLSKSSHFQPIFRVIMLKFRLIASVSSRRLQ